MITPWYIGDTAPTWTVQLIPDSGAFNVTGLTTGSFSLLFRNLTAGTETTGTGTFSSIVAAVTSTVGGVLVVTSPATINYSVATGDAASAGNYQVLIKVTFSSGAVQTLNLGSWQVVPS
jgi:hypothetical protein